jgi:hypothetical protein
LGRHRPKSPSHSPPSPRPSRHHHDPPSAGPWQLKKEGGGRPESAFEGLLRQHPLSPAVLTPQGMDGSPISRFAANRDPDSRFPAESGNGPIPDSRFPADRESGIPSPFPAQIGNRGNGNWGFPGLALRHTASGRGSLTRGSQASRCQPWSSSESTIITECQ